NRAAAREGEPTAPQHGHAEPGGTLHEFCMQYRSPDTEAKALGELSFDRSHAIRAVKANAAERTCLTTADRDPQPSHRRQRVWHQTFAASLIDRKMIMISHSDTQAPLRG